LRVLMKKGEEEFAPVDLNQLVLEVLEFVRGEFVMRNVEVRPSLSPDLPQVDGNRVQLQQLILNLVSNACEAMHGSARSEKRLDITTVHGADDSVQVIVTDTGPGIETDQLDRIFDPFVTTKEHGLGLGLAICRKIARAHRGTLVADHRHDSGEAQPFAWCCRARKLRASARHDRIEALEPARVGASPSLTAHASLVTLLDAVDQFRIG
jgi:C4-dicarboxylate-specific signal transduction histidine kinase